MFLVELSLCRLGDFLAHIAGELSKPGRTGLGLREAHEQCLCLLQKGDTLDERATRQLAEVGRRLILVRSFFNHPSVASHPDF